jgi:DNA mismatch repair protein MutS2
MSSIKSLVSLRLSHNPPANSHIARHKKYGGRSKPLSNSTASRATEAALPAARSKDTPVIERAAEDDPVAAAAQHESLHLLEWALLCRQVACFTQTPQGAEVALSAKLPLGRSPVESERLLQETEQAQQAQLQLKGVYDLRLALNAAQSSHILHPLVLGAVANTLATATRTWATLHASDVPCPELLHLARGLRDTLTDLQTAITTCIQVGWAGGVHVGSTGAILSTVA